MALGTLTAQWHLPVYSLPFCITVFCLLYFFSLKVQKGRVVLTPLQFYSPEKNLYNYVNNKERLANVNSVRLQSPFIGQWIVSQGYDGNLTHKGEWSKALDFVIVDHELKTYDQYAVKPENFYCYGKPVLAAADGFVEKIEDYIDDNEIGKIDQNKNWGNSIVIKHAEGVYTKMSHLKKGTFRVAVGDYVKQGDIVAACGNSGRSPEPHLHFQVQTTPHIGSKTLAYPLAQFAVIKDGKTAVQNFTVPQESDIVYNTVIDTTLKQAFEFLPGLNLSVQAQGFDEGRWEVFTDAYNQSYIFCHQSKAVAYFKKNERIFYFTSFSGNKNSLLYYFYLASYKVYLSTEPFAIVSDTFPLQLINNSLLQWIQDIISPFYIFGRLQYESTNEVNVGNFLNSAVTIKSKQSQLFLSHKKNTNQFVIDIEEQKISSFSFQLNHQTIKAVCVSKLY